MAKIKPIRLQVTNVNKTVAICYSNGRFKQQILTKRSKEMKKQNLDETWRLCLKMWKWIVKEWRKGKGQNVEILKAVWLKKNHFKDIKDDCFFCNYAVRVFKRGRLEKYVCYYCPAAKIDKEFSCVLSECNYFRSPDKFLNKLRALNRKRLKAKTHGGK